MFLLNALLVAPVLALVPNLASFLWLGLVPYPLAAGHAAASLFGGRGAALRGVGAVAMALVFFIGSVASLGVAYVLLLVR